MKKLFSLHLGYLQIVFLLTSFCLLHSSCLRHTNQQDKLQISNQTKNQNSKKINLVSKKSTSKKQKINAENKENVLLITEENVAGNIQDQKNEIAFDSTKVSDSYQSDSIELEKYFAELEKVEVDSSDFVLIEDD